MTAPDDTRWGLVLVLWAAGLGAAAQYGKISVIFDMLPTLYPDVGTALGFAVSLVGLVGILLGVAAGALVSSVGYRRTLVAALWVGAVMSGLQALGLPFGAFLASRVAEGLSHLGVVVAAPTLIAQFSADRHRGFTLTLWGTFFGVAFALLAWAGRPLAATAGVPVLFAAHGVVMACLAVGLNRALRAAPMPALTTAPDLRALMHQHIAIYRSPRISAPAAGWLFYTACFVSVLTVLPPFLAPEIRVLIIGAMPLASIAVSLTFGVWLLKVLSAVQVVQLGFLLSAAAMVWLGVAPGSPAACLALAGALGLVQGASFAAVPQLNATAAHRAQANGGMAQTGNLGNTLGTPLMVAVIAQAGYGGMVGLAVALFLMGLAVHAGLAWRRVGTQGDLR